MNNTSRGLPDHTPRGFRRNSIAYLITVGLGYCCEKAFWERHINISTESIGIRLGVTGDACYRHREKFLNDEYHCHHGEGCIKDFIKERQNG